MSLCQCEQTVNKNRKPIIITITSAKVALHWGVNSTNFWLLFSVTPGCQLSRTNRETCTIDSLRFTRPRATRPFSHAVKNNSRTDNGRRTRTDRGQRGLSLCSAPWAGRQERNFSKFDIQYRWTECILWADMLSRWSRSMIALPARGEKRIETSLIKPVLAEVQT